MENLDKKTKSELLTIISNLQLENESLKKKAHRGAGRHPALSDEEIESIITLHNKGLGVTAIMNTLVLTCSSMTVSRVIRRYKESI